MKHNFSYLQDELFFGCWRENPAEFISLKKLTHNYKGPTYVYDLKLVERQWGLLQAAVGSVHMHFAMKSNFHPQILRKILQLGGGVDTVSWGEIQHALQNGFSPQQIVFSGVGKTTNEIDQALRAGIYQLNVESDGELERLRDRARALNLQAHVVLRVNPDVSVNTHPYIATGMRDNKFGIGLAELPRHLEILKSAKDVLHFVGLSSHLGSQLLEFSGIAEALEIQKKLFCDLKRDFPQLHRFDIGGGLGVLYQDQDFEKEQKMLLSYGEIITKVVKDLQTQFPGEMEFQSEPGRYLVAHAGLLLCQVQYVKKTQHKTFVVLDSGMNHLMRPTLYQAYHPIYPLIQRAGEEVYDFVGPICESADFFAKDRKTTRLEPGDFIVVGCAGAYGAAMANRYNLHELPQEMVID